MDIVKSMNNNKLNLQLKTERKKVNEARNLAQQFSNKVLEKNGTETFLSFCKNKSPMRLEKSSSFLITGKGLYFYFNSLSYSYPY